MNAEWVFPPTSTRVIATKLSTGVGSAFNNTEMLPVTLTIQTARVANARPDPVRPISATCQS